MKTVEWQPHVNISQVGVGLIAPEDITQDDDFWLDVRKYSTATLTVEILYAEGAAMNALDLAIEVSDDPSSGIWNVAWQRSRYDASSEEGTYLVTLSRQIQIGRPFHLGSALRWRTTGWPATAAEIAFRIVATLQ